MIYCRRLDLASELDVILLVLFKDKSAQVTLRGGVLSLDFFVHFFETFDNKFQDISVFLFEHVLL